MKIPVVGLNLDERFLDHRRRSSSYAGLAGAVLAVVLFETHLILQHRIDWELFSIPACMVAVKFAFMAWYRFIE